MMHNNRLWALNMMHAERLWFSNFAGDRNIDQCFMQLQRFRDPGTKSINVAIRRTQNSRIATPWQEDVKATSGEYFDNKTCSSLPRGPDKWCLYVQYDILLASSHH